MVSSQIKEEVKDIIAGMFHGDTGKAVDYLWKCGVLDENKCRIAVIKRQYRQLRCSGLSAADAKNAIAERFCRSDTTIHNIIYNPFYADITI